MSVSSIGGDTSQAWQILRESRAKQSASSSATGAPAAPPPKNPLPGAPPDALASGAADVSRGSTAAPGVSGASAKVIADLKALFISLQSGSASNTTGSTGASSVGAASNSTAATSTGTAGATPASGTTLNVQSDLKTLFSDLSKVSGHGGHHHSHGKPPAAQSTTPSSDITAGTPTTGPAAASVAAKPSGGLLDQLAGALKAYAAASIDNSARGATALLSA